MGKRGNGDGTIKQLKDGTWRSAFTREDGTRQWFRGQTREAVKDRLDDALIAQRNGMLVTSGKRKYGEWLEQWLEDYVQPNVAETTYERYRGIVRNYLKEALGRIRLVDLRGPHIQRYYRSLRERPLAPATISLHHSVVYHSLGDAHLAGVIARNVAQDAKAPPPRGRDASDHAISDAEWAKILPLIAGHRHEQLWWVLKGTGMRIGEALALKWSLVNLDERVLYVRASYRRALSGPLLRAPKTRRGRRVIPLGRDDVAALQAQRTRVLEMQLKALQWADNDLVFPNSLGRPLRADRVLAEFKAVTGRPDIRLHDLRHSYATDLYAAGAHPRAVQELMGHARIEMTMDLYTGSVPEILREAVQRRDERAVRRNS